jgi:hypothetical protein
MVLPRAGIGQGEVAEAALRAREGDAGWPAGSLHGIANAVLQQAQQVILDA